MREKSGGSAAEENKGVSAPSPVAGDILPGWGRNILSTVPKYFSKKGLFKLRFLRYNQIVTNFLRFVSKERRK